MYSILLINGHKIDITEEQFMTIRHNINNLKNIALGNYLFPSHQIAVILPKTEADFREKMELRTKGFYRCKSYGVIHKLGENCECKATGEIAPQLTNQKLLSNP